MSILEKLWPRPQEEPPAPARPTWNLQTQQGREDLHIPVLHWQNVGDGLVLNLRFVRYAGFHELMSQARATQEKQIAAEVQQAIAPDRAKVGERLSRLQEQSRAADDKVTKLQQRLDEIGAQVKHARETAADNWAESQVRLEQEATQVSADLEHARASHKLLIGELKEAWDKIREVPAHAIAAAAGTRRTELLEEIRVARGRIANSIGPLLDALWQLEAAQLYLSSLDAVRQDVTSRVRTTG
jgi:chromosome segregation ATPase